MMKRNTEFLGEKKLKYDNCVHNMMQTCDLWKVLSLLKSKHLKLRLLNIFIKEITVCKT